MRLSQLKSLIAQIEAACLPSNPDPDIRLSVERSAVITGPGPLESTTFVDFDLATSQIKTGFIVDHRIVDYGRPEDYIPSPGDYSLPLEVVPHYTKCLPDRNLG